MMPLFGKNKAANYYFDSVVVQNRPQGVPFARHRLDDNLLWQCSSCREVVPTHKTRSHLVSCFKICTKVKTILFPFSQLEFDQEFNSMEKSIVPNSIVPNSINRQPRPRTKKLERPTPNLKHPVINDHETKESKICCKEKQLGRSHDVEKSKSKTKTIKIKSNTTRSENLLTARSESLPIVRSESLPTAKNENLPTARNENLPTARNENLSTSCNTCKTRNACNKTTVDEKSPSNKKSTRSKKDESIINSLDVNTSGCDASAKEVANHEQKAISHNPSHNFPGKKIDANANKISVGNIRDQTTNMINGCIYSKCEASERKKLFVKCYICNNSFDTTTLSSHEQKCLEAKKREELMVEPDERRLEPPKLQLNNDSLSKAGCDPAGWEHFKSQLVPCPRCCRTFFPHRLPAHEKSCQGTIIKSTIKYNESTVPPKSAKIAKPLYLYCGHCGRKYSTASLTLHELKCRNKVKTIGSGSQKGKNDTNNEMTLAWENFKSQLVPCSKCRRKFLPDRLDKHEPNCKANPINEASNKTKTKQ